MVAGLIHMTGKIGSSNVASLHAAENCFYDVSNRNRHMLLNIQLISELHYINKSMSRCYTKSPIAQVYCLMYIHIYTAVSVVSMKKG